MSASEELIEYARTSQFANEPLISEFADALETSQQELAELTASFGSDHIAAKYWKQRQDARNERKRVTVERDAALAVIADVRAWTGRYKSGYYDEAQDDITVILRQAPASALAQVKADALDEARWKLAQIRDATTWAEKPAVIVAAIAEIIGDSAKPESEATG